MTQQRRQALTFHFGSYLYAQEANTHMTEATNPDLNALRTSDIYDAIDSQLIDGNHDGQGNRLIGSMHGNRLKDIEAFVEKVQVTEDVGFYKTAGGFKPSTFSASFKRMPSFFAQEESGWTYSLRVQQFFEAAKMLPAMRFKVPEVPCYGRTEGEVFNGFIQRLRELCRSSEFRDELRKQDYRSARRFGKLKKYVEKLFTLYSPLLVIRIELKYGGCEVSLNQALNDFSKPVNNRRHNSIFEHQVGYVRRLEFGTLPDQHQFHVVFFFDGSQVRN